MVLERARPPRPDGRPPPTPWRTHRARSRSNRVLSARTKRDASGSQTVTNAALRTLNCRVVPYRERAPRQG
jgi:hypothetical protein